MEVKLWNDKREREMYENFAELYAIIKATEKLEKAYIGDVISPSDYETECVKLIAHFKTLSSSLKDTVPSIESFVDKYKMDCRAALNRLVTSGVPATVEHRAAAAASNTTSAATVAECVQNFITAMDSLKIQTPNTDDNNQNTNPDLHKQNELFVRERIPMWISGAGYIPLSIVSTIVIPFMFPQIKWYYVIVAYILSPIISFANAYGAGLTDQNMAYNYGKVAIFILAALAGKDNGLVAGLVGCGVIKSVAFVSCTLMQDFKTGHMTLSSPRSMLISQAVGTAIGCIAASLSFFLFYQAFDVGNPTGEYKAPYALIYRNMAILGVQGFSALPQHCLQLCYGFFAIAVGLNLLRDLLPSRIGKLMPLPMVMAVPFLVGGSSFLFYLFFPLIYILVYKLCNTS